MTSQPNAVPPIPEGCASVMPWIISRDTAKLLDFLKQAFAAQELSRAYNEDGTIGHAEAKIGDSIIGGFDAREGWPETPCAPRVCTSKMPMLCTSKPSLLEPLPSPR
jgi:PhnB protein